MIINVTKRSGKKELLDLEKWQAQVSKVCKGIADVSPSMIEIKSQLHFYDGISTTQIDGINVPVSYQESETIFNYDTNYDVEQIKNESYRSIKIIKPEIVQDVINNYQKFINA